MPVIYLEDDTPGTADTVETRTHRLAGLLQSGGFDLDDALALVEAGVDVTAASYAIKGFRKMTLLHLAVRANSFEVCRALVARGAATDASLEEEVMRHTMSGIVKQWRTASSVDFAQRCGAHKDITVLLSRCAVEWGALSDDSVYMKEGDDSIASVVRVFNFRARECTRTVNKAADGTVPFAEVEGALIDKAIETARKFSLDVDLSAVPRKGATGVVISKKSAGGGQSPGNG